MGFGHYREGDGLEGQGWSVTSSSDEKTILLSEMEKEEDAKNLCDLYFHEDLHIGTLIFNRIPMRYYKLSVPWGKEFAEEAVYSTRRLDTDSELYDPGEGVSTVIDVANITHKKIHVIYVLSRLGASYILHGQYEALDKRFRMENPEWQS